MTSQERSCSCCDAPLCTATATNSMQTRQRCSTKQIHSEDTFSPCFQKLPKEHNAIFSILSNTDRKFVDFHVPCSTKDVSQKRLASLVVELLSVITRLKYKSGYDTFLLQHCTKHTQGSYIPICGWFQTRCPDSSWMQYCSFSHM